MDPTKKRKLDENGVETADPALKLTVENARKILEPFTQDQLLDVLQGAILSHPDVLDAVRSIADRDVSLRKLFIRGLGWESTSDSLRSVFTAFGELEEAVVILDKNTSKSKGYGFVTYRHVDGAVLALKEPSKKIDGRVAVAQLASLGHASGGSTGHSGAVADVALRKIYVANVPYDMPSERLLNHFLVYGEIEEGPLGFDKVTGKSKGFALFVYKTPEGAQAALAEPAKMIDGKQLLCKLAIEGKKGRPGSGPGGPAVPGQGPAGDGMGIPPGGAGHVPGPYGAVPPYGGFPGGPGIGQHQNPGNAPYPSSATAQGPVGYGAAYGGGYGGGSHYGGPNASGGYGGFGGAAGGYGGGSGTGLGGGVGGAARGYGLPQGSSGMPAAGYGDGHYGLSSAYPGQGSQPTGTSPAPRVPPGGMYANVPPYY